MLRFKKDPCGNSYYAFACGIYEALKSKGAEKEADLIVPIPASAEKLRKRGYNQTKLIAKELSYLMDRRCCDALVKVRDTRDQKSLPGKERPENVKGAFAVNERYRCIAGKSILVIDDVCTTGSTLSEAAKVLREAGAARVYAAAFAKTPFSEYHSV